jgi:hypothetical protein
VRALPEIVLALLLLALLGLAAWLTGQCLPLMLPIGLGLSAAAPLVFLIGAHRLHAQRRHPVLVSVFAGFGCVMCMVGVQRFGEQHQWIAALALLALASWMVYQRWFWRRPGPPQDQARNS